MSERAPYSRVYWSVMDDPKFDGVREDARHLGAWLLLLIVADMAHPAPAFVPSTVPKASLRVLTECGLIDAMSGGRFRVHGLASERGMRSDTGRNASASRWHSVRNAKPILDETSIDKTRRDEQSREGLPNLDRPAITVLEERTGALASQAGERQLSEYDRLVGRHGLVAVSAAFDSVSGGKPMTARQLVWAAMKVLEPFVDPKSVAQTERAEESDAAHRRRLAVTQRELRSLREVGS